MGKGHSLGKRDVSFNQMHVFFLNGVDPCFLAPLLPSLQKIHLVITWHAKEGADQGFGLASPHFQCGLSCLVLVDHCCWQVFS